MKLQEIDCKASDQVFRFIKKIEKSDDFVDSALTFSALTEEKVKQNVALEIYEEYFDEDDPATNMEDFDVKTVISYPDPSRMENNPSRPVSQELNNIFSLRPFLDQQHQFQSRRRRHDCHLILQ